MMASVDRTYGDAQQKGIKNVVDPFATLVMAAKMGITEERNLIGFQSLVSSIRNISSAVGSFHQTILGSIAGWENHDAGYDLENQDRKLLAEVKNKWNTMNATNKAAVVDDLDTAVRQKGRGWEGYLVLVVPRTPNRYTVDISRSPARSVCEIDGASFYELATGQPNALAELYECVDERLTRTKGTDETIREACRRIFAQAYG